MLKRIGGLIDGLSNMLPRMNCARAGALLPLHVAGDLQGRRARAVTQHLQACAHCRAQADDYAASRAWLQAGAQPVFEDEFYADIRAAVLRQIRQTHTPVPFFAPLFNWRLASVVAAIALLCVVGASAWRAHNQRQRDIELARTIKPGAAQTTHGNEQNNVAAKPSPAPAAILEHKQAAPSDQTASKRVRQLDRRAPVAPAYVVRALPQRDALDLTQIGPQPAASVNTEVARIEFQTADPNVRIIWLSSQTVAATDTTPITDNR